MDEGAYDPCLEDALRTFYESPTCPVTNHEEWLLRLCTQLMHREVEAVSLLERQAKQGKRHEGQIPSDSRKNP